MNKLIYLFDVIGAIGDTLCTEPVVRYAIKNLGEGADIRILTNLPHLFRHLGKPMGLNWEDLGLTYNNPNVKHLYNRLELITDGVRTMHPIIEWISPHLIEPIDFISVMMLKRTLPDADKRIKIEFSDNSSAIEGVIGVRLDDLVVVHAGTGAPENTRLLPESYCNKLLDCLVADGHRVAVIATTDKRSHATKINNDKVINLIDKLNWDDFCTVISKAKVLVTNDSSPVHIASMFDNWLVALPTVKHPDRLIHPRKGMRYHKAIALYQKLMCDDSTEIPVGQIVTHFDWTGIDNYRENYLALPHVVAKHVSSAASGERDQVGGVNPEI